MHYRLELLDPYTLEIVDVVPLKFASRLETAVTLASRYFKDKVWAIVDVKTDKTLASNVGEHDVGPA